MNLFAWILVSVAGFYAAIGIAFALFFVTRGAGRVDPAAAEGTLGFRLLIFPGSVALWPLLMQRHRGRIPPPEEHNAHRDLARRREGAPADTMPHIDPAGSRDTAS